MSAQNTTAGKAAVDAVNSAVRPGVPEPVDDIRHDGGTVTTRVISTGCTLSEHFHIEHRLEAGICYATIVRDKPDLCRRAPIAVDITIPWARPDGCGPNAVQFTNPSLDAGSKALDRRLPEQ